MKEKIRKLIDENFSRAEVFDDNEEDFTVAVGNTLDILDDKIEELPTNTGSGLFAFKSKVFPGDALSEPTTRTVVESDGKDFFDSPSEYESDDENDVRTSDEDESDSFDDKNTSVVQSDEEQEDSDSFDDEESDIEDDIDTADDKNAYEVGDLSGVFSKKIVDVSSEQQKAKAVTNQLHFWDNLIESRILLQKCIAEINDSSADQLLPERQSSIEYLEKYLTRLRELQEKIRRETTQREDIGEEDYATFRNNTIETWYNRTRGARSNFSAFETPLLKQIEKAEMIKKTYLQRTEPLENMDETGSTEPSVRMDTETVNDDDFYHKLLRHYIKRKTANISDSTQLGRHWIKLQNLRSKMKRKIDTRRTKARKIKFDPHPKLMNFMAVRNLRKWEDEAINELFSSVFGKKSINCG